MEYGVILIKRVRETHGDNQAEYPLSPYGNRAYRC